MRMPLIKWTGSKRSQAEAIVDNFPKDIDTYYEPFVGGGSVFYEVLQRVNDGTMRVKKIVCSDLNRDLIGIWNAFKDNYESLYTYYCNQRSQLISYSSHPEEAVNDKSLMEEVVSQISEFYYNERDRLNKMSEDDPERPYLFFWITRTCFNGLIRYNPAGKFNTPFHVGGKYGISPEKLRKTIDDWHTQFENAERKGVSIEFKAMTFDEAVRNAKAGDVVYMDPPYEFAKKSMYFSNFDNTSLFGTLEMLNNSNVTWLMSYDGKSGDTDNTNYGFPKHLYDRHVYVNSGQSNFKKLKGKGLDEVRDSLYMRFHEKETF